MEMPFLQATTLWEQTGANPAVQVEVLILNPLGAATRPQIGSIIGRALKHSDTLTGMAAIQALGEDLPWTEATYYMLALTLAPGLNASVDRLLSEVFSQVSVAARPQSLRCAMDYILRLVTLLPEIPAVGGSAALWFRQASHLGPLVHGEMTKRAVTALYWAEIAHTRVNGNPSPSGFPDKLKRLWMVATLLHASVQPKTVSSFVDWWLAPPHRSQRFLAQYQQNQVGARAFVGSILDEAWFESSA